MNPITPDIPANFARLTREVHGERGAEWLAQLPSLLADVADRWALTLAPPFEHLSYNYVAPALRADGTQAVVKAGVPNEELLCEIDALTWYDGRGIVRLLEADRELGLMLLERLTPGNALLDERDERRAVSIAATVMRELRRPAPPAHRFPSVADWGRGFARLREQFDGGTGPFAEHTIDAASHLFDDLLASMEEPVLLHGDLHHGNIVAGRGGWLAIDPKGVIGEPAYEIGAYLRNPLPRLLAEPHPERVLAARIDQFTEELGLDRARIAGWAFAQAVLSAWWSYEDHGGGWEEGIACAEYLARVM